MHQAVARTHAMSLSTLADEFERENLSGSSEIAFLLRRATRQIAKVYDFKVALPDEPRARDEAVEVLKAG